jgi:hypothetical protein
VIEQRATALRENVRRVIAWARRVKWIHLHGSDHLFSIAVQIKSARDLERLSELELSKTLDAVPVDSVYSDSTLLAVCDALYTTIAISYNQHDIHIEVTHNNQPVFSTTYFNKPPL